MTEPKLTDFQKKVLRHVPKWPGQMSINKIVSRVYDDGWQGWKKARGRKTAVSKALNQLQRYKLIDWNPHPFSDDWWPEYWWKR